MAEETKAPELPKTEKEEQAEHKQKVEDAKTQAKRFSIRLLIEVGLFLLSLVVFVYIVKNVVLENEATLDNWGWNLVAPLRSEGMTRFMQAITVMGSWYFLMPAWIVLILWFLFYRKRKSLSMDIFSIAVTSTVVMFGLKILFQRQRPLDPLLHAVPGFSFPSGHSFSSFTFWGVLVYIIADWKNISRPLKWVLSIICILIAATIATSRVYLKVHYPSDVIAGFFLCVIWLGVSFFVLHRVRGKRFVES